MVSPTALITALHKYQDAGYNVTLEQVLDHLDAAKCGRGWVGVKGECKRSKAVKTMSGADKKAWRERMMAANTPEERRALAESIRKERGLKPLAGKAKPKVAEPEPEADPPPTKGKKKRPAKKKSAPKSRKRRTSAKTTEEPKTVAPKKTPAKKRATKAKAEPKAAKKPPARGKGKGKGSAKAPDQIPPKVKPETTQPPKARGKAEISNKQAGDGTQEGMPKNAKAFAKATGLSEAEAQQQWDAVESYTDVDLYGKIRAAQREGKDGDPELLALADKAEAFVKNSEPFKGEVYRGMSFASADEVRNIFQEGGEFTTDALTSFSSYSKAAERFAAKTVGDFFNDSQHGVFITVKSNKSGAPIREASAIPGENEVLVTSGVKYRIVSVTTEEKEGRAYKSTRGKAGKDTYTNVILEEI